MKRLCYIFFVLLCISSYAGCSAKKDNAEADSANITNTAKDTVAAPTDGVDVNDSADQADQITAEGTVMEVKYESEAIAQNLIGQPAERTIYIYLPPSYNTGDKAYPVVYFLHGYGDSPQSFMTMYQPKFDEWFNNGEKEFIVVALDGNTVCGGSFYVNSPSSGNWEDYVVKELVAYMDQNYRTIPDVNSRGISGYSMGGFGALNLSLKHPDVFCSTLVFCPGVFAEDNLDAVITSWSSSYDIKKTYAQAFSPNTEDTENYGNIIKKEDIEAKNQVWKDWMNGFSNWNQKVSDYLALKQPLKSIMINYSKEDYYSWIPGGCEYLTAILKDNNISYSSDLFSGGHIVPGDAVEKYFGPFFDENLSFE